MTERYKWGKIETRNKGGYRAKKGQELYRSITFTLFMATMNGSFVLYRMLWGKGDNGQGKHTHITGRVDEVVRRVAEPIGRTSTIIINSPKTVKCVT